jgi:hypothetical protein
MKKVVEVTTLEGKQKSSVIRKGSRIAGQGITRFITAGLKYSEHRGRRWKLYCGDAAYCSRKSVLFATTEGQNVMSAASLLYMDIGTVIHRVFQKGLEKAGVLVEAERRVNLRYKDIELSGMIDGILKIDDEYKILEIKTCGGLPGKPKKEHLHQALTYALITGIYKVVIFYQSRKVAGWEGKLECVEFEIDVNPTQLDMVAEILATSFVCAKKKVIPPIPLHIGSQGDCGFCPFTTICWGESSKRFPKLKPSIEDEIEVAKNALLSMSRKAHKEYA